jgi:DNA polymerase-3 subunit alpha
MGDVERAGLLKMDFLGLRNLTILARTIELVEQSQGKRIDPYKFPIDDKETFALLCRGETKGIFQLESGGIRDLLQRMKPDHFRDVIATNALYRPGPLEGGMVDDYIAVKHGRQEAEYPHPVMKDILAETHGVMVYQEQVMRILNALGGIQLSNAYTCIKAISKKKLPMIAKYREEFIDGAHQKGLDKKRAEELFGMIEKFAGYGFNKCLVGETELTHADTGERTSIESLFHNRRPWRVQSLTSEGKLVKRTVTDVVWNGRKRVYKITTALGRVLTATANHPLRTFNGWTLVEQLKPGDRVAAPRALECEGDLRWAEHELVTLAGLISEGNTCHPTCLYFYNNNADFVADFVNAVERFPDTRARVDVRRNTRHEVCVSTGRDTRIRAGASSTTTSTKGIRSGAYRWAAALGILNKNARNKSIPADVFRLADAQTELFLGRLWSGDGFVGAPGQMPFYATSSLQLAYDVQSLLLRIGIVSRVATKVMRYRYKGELRTKTGCTVHLVGNESVRRFIGRLGPHMIGRGGQLAVYNDYLLSIPSATSKDTIPSDIRKLVDEERRAAGLGWRQLEAQSGVSMREFSSRNSITKKGFRRATIAKLATFFESKRLREQAESDIYWDRVVSIESGDITDVYDLTVEDEHNFVADGLVVHNSHSTAYALIAYMTAYLKAHYAVEFMAALLSCDIPGRNFKSKDSLVEHLEDCQRMNIEVVPPNVNTCDPDFTVADGKILFGLGAIKSCGTGAAEAIAAERKKNGPYKSLFDFCERVDPQLCNRATIEALVKAGACDSLGGHRAQLMLMLDRALQSGAAAAADRRSGQKGLFGDDEEDDVAAAPVDLPNIPPWDEKDQLAREKEVLGFYLSSHPLAEYEQVLRTYCTGSESLANMNHRDEVVLGGMLAAIKFSHTKNPRPGSTHTKYAMWDLEDLDGLVRCIMWPEQFAEFGTMVEADKIVGIVGKVDRRPGSEETNIIVDKLLTLDDLAKQFSSGMIIRVREDQHGEQALVQLKEIVRGYPGSKRLKLRLDLASGGQVWLECGSSGIEPNPELNARIDQLLGDGNRIMERVAPQSQNNGNGNGNGRRPRQPARA